MDDNEKVNGLKNKFQDFIVTRPYDFLYAFSIIVGTVIRLIVSLNAYGMLHPDEIFQSLEMAHLLVYGSGYVPPEFQSHYPIESYAASRSWIFPLIFAGIMRLGELLGLDYFYGTLVLIKVFLALNAAILIPVSKKFVEELTQDTKTGVITAFIIAFYFRLIQFTVRSFSNTFFLPYLIYGLYRILKAFNEEKLSLTAILEVGLYVGLVTYIRTDLGILVFALFISTFKLKYWTHYLTYAISGALFWLFGAIIDHQIYDDVIFFSVPIHWFRFNIIEGYSKIFGVSGPLYYIVRLVFADFLIIWLAITIYFIIDWKHLIEEYNFPTDIQQGFKVMNLTVLITWIIYSNAWPIFPEFSIIPPRLAIAFPQSHKEVRFIIGGLVYLLYLVGISLRLIILRIAQSDYLFTKRVNLSKLIGCKDVRRETVLTFILLALFFMHITGGFVFGMYPEVSEDVNKSLIYIGNNNNVERVVIVEDWFLTGYFTYSHLPKSVEFKFYPMHNPDHASNNKIRLRIAIFDESKVTYILFPEYQYTYYEDVQELMIGHNWMIVKEIGGVDIWFISQ